MQGAIADQVIKLSSITLDSKAGSVTGSGSYDLHAQRFQAEARGTGLDVAGIEHLHAVGETVAGKLGFTATASGTMQDPRIEAHATLSDLMVDREPKGSLELSAHTVNRNLLYDVASRMDAAELALHGQTELRGDYQTQARLDFSRFNIAALFRLAHLDAIKGESALSGTATVRGPLARVDELQGEARLATMAVTVAGVHLQSEGGVHAALANARVSLDPLHVTGDQTDLRAQGSLELKEAKRLEFRGQRLHQPEARGDG